MILRLGVIMTLLVATVGAAPQTVVAALATYASYSAMDVRNGVGVFFHCDFASLEQSVDKVNADADMADAYKLHADSQLLGPEAAACALQERDEALQRHDIRVTGILVTTQAITAQKLQLPSAKPLGKLARVILNWLAAHGDASDVAQAKDDLHVLNKLGL